METEVLRFKFLPPSENDIRNCGFFKRAAPIVFVLCIVAIIYIFVSGTYIKLTSEITVIALWSLVYALSRNPVDSKIEQAKYGFIELTPTELRISRSFSSLLRIDWYFLEPIEVKRSKLRLRFAEFISYQPDKSGSDLLYLIPLKEVENSEALIAELEKRQQLRGKSGDVLANCQTNPTFIP